jgi:hypothetical protein
VAVAEAHVGVGGGDRPVERGGDAGLAADGERPGQAVVGRPVVELEAYEGLAAQEAPLGAAAHEVGDRLDHRGDVLGARLVVHRQRQLVQPVLARAPGAQPQRRRQGREREGRGREQQPRGNDDPYPGVRSLAAAGRGRPRRPVRRRGAARARRRLAADGGRRRRVLGECPVPVVDQAGEVERQDGAAHEHRGDQDGGELRGAAHVGRPA